jgi:hypothetical protein
MVCEVTSRRCILSIIVIISPQSLKIERICVVKKVIWQRAGGVKATLTAIRASGVEATLAVIRASVVEAALTAFRASRV